MLRDRDNIKEIMGIGSCNCGGQAIYHNIISAAGEPRKPVVSLSESWWYHPGELLV